MPNTASYRERLLAIYIAHAPQKAGQVDALLRKYEGREAALVEAALLKYGPASPTGPTDAPVDTAAEAGTGTGTTEANTVYHDRLRRIYERYAVSRLPLVERDLAKYPGREEEVIQAAMKKYGPEPPVQPAAPAAQADAGQLPVHGSPEAPLLTAATVAAAPPDHKSRIIHLYTSYAPHRLARVDHELTKYKGREEALIRAIEEKYVRVGAGASLPPSAQLATEGPQQPTHGHAPSEILSGEPGTSGKDDGAFLQPSPVTVAVPSASEAVVTPSIGDLEPSYADGSSRNGPPDHKSRIIHLYTSYAPHRLSRVDHELTKYKGREEALIRAIEAKYVKATSPAVDVPPLKTASAMTPIPEPSERAEPTRDPSPAPTGPVRELHMTPPSVAAEDAAGGMGIGDEDVASIPVAAPRPMDGPPLRLEATLSAETTAAVSAALPLELEGRACTPPPPPAPVRSVHFAIPPLDPPTPVQRAGRVALGVPLARETSPTREAALLERQPATAAMETVGVEAMVVEVPDSGAQGAVGGQVPALVRWESPPCESSVSVAERTAAPPGGVPSAPAHAQASLGNHVEVAGEVVHVDGLSAKDARGLSGSDTPTSPPPAAAETTPLTHAPLPDSRVGQEGTVVNGEPAAEVPHPMATIAYREEEEETLEAVSGLTAVRGAAGQTPRTPASSAHVEARQAEEARFSLPSVVVYDSFRVLGTTVVADGEVIDQRTCRVLLHHAWGIDLASLSAAAAHHLSGEFIREPHFAACIEVYGVDHRWGEQEAALHTRRCEAFLAHCRRTLSVATAPVAETLRDAPPRGPADVTAAAAGRELGNGFWVYFSLYPCVLPTWERRWAYVLAPGAERVPSQLTICRRGGTRADLTIPFGKLLACFLESIVGSGPVAKGASPPAGYGKHGLVLCLAESPSPLEVRLCCTQARHSHGIVRAYQTWQRIARDAGASGMVSPCSSGRHEGGTCSRVSGGARASPVSPLHARGAATDALLACLAWTRVWVCQGRHESATGADGLLAVGPTPELFAWAFLDGGLLHVRLNGSAPAGAAGVASAQWWDVATEMVGVGVMTEELPVRPPVCDARHAAFVLERCGGRPPLFCWAASRAERGRLLSQLRRLALRHRLVGELARSTAGAPTARELTYSPGGGHGGGS